MTIPSIVTRGRGFGGSKAIVTHGLEAASPAPTPTPTPSPFVILGGGAFPPGWRRELGESYLYPSQRLREEEEKLSKQIARKEHERDAERKRLEQRLAAKGEAETLARSLEALDASIREEINRLSIEKAALIRRIDDEEAILTLLLSNPFV